LHRAREIARDAGLHYVYEGNIYSDGANTNCPSCGLLLIRRSWHDVTENHLKHGRCPQCDAEIPGVWERNARDAARPAQPSAEKYSHLNL
jgi:pyruvate formate lyase activating enzyme